MKSEIYSESSIVNESIESLRAGNTSKAIELLEEYIKENPGESKSIQLLGIAKGLEGDHGQALALFKIAILWNPSNSWLYLNLAKAMAQLNHHRYSIKWCKKAETINPEAVELKISLASELLNNGDLLQAKEYCLAAIALNPQAEDAYLAAGSAWSALENHEDARINYGRSIIIRPDNSNALSNMSGSLWLLNKRHEALECCRKALVLKPDSFDAINNIGIFLYRSNNSRMALANFKRSIRIDPKSAKAWIDAGSAIIPEMLFSEAISFYLNAIVLNPGFAMAYSNVAELLLRQDRSIEAFPSLNRAYRISPEMRYLIGSILFCQMRNADWKTEPHFYSFLADVENLKPTISPFVMLMLTDNPLVHRKCAETYNKAEGLIGIRGASKREKSLSGPIKIGYYSADFHNHATSHLMIELFEIHSREEFEIFAFSFGPETNDQLQKRAKKSFSGFYVVNQLSDEEVVSLSKQIGIDIAVDLKGFTQDARPRIFALGCAPVQVSYLGFPGTTGSDYIDYLVADRHLIPQELRKYYSENIIYLPDSYQANGSNRLISPAPVFRKDYKLPDNSFVFCCFNKVYKINQNIFSLWMDILRETKGSVLWLLEDNPLARANIKNEAIINGISGCRIIFANTLPIDEHLARHRLADLFLDTYPCGAHTTASDSLWAGLPVLTCPGSSFASRVASSLLHTLNLNELIVNDLFEYRAKAVEIAKNPSHLLEIKKKLEYNLASSPLFDIKSTTRSLERAYKEIYFKYHSGKKPIDINNL